MKHNGLIFIPDISGFTQFVGSVDLKHSQHIIQELLETILDANQMGLDVSEVEGNAILFYKLGESPDLDITYKQVEKMFMSFHKHLALYESRRTCHCNACISAIHLSLKIITHYGEFTEYKIKDFPQLIGKDIIIAHQLLQNDIPQHEYWLITSILSGGKPPEKFTPFIKWDHGTKQVYKGEITFHFAQLSHLKNK
jgi:predicted nucleic-acid-binding protein